MKKLMNVLISGSLGAVVFVATVLGMVRLFVAAYGPAEFENNGGANFAVIVISISVAWVSFFATGVPAFRRLQYGYWFRSKKAKLRHYR